MEFEAEDSFLLCLGAGEHQVPLIRAAKDLGHRLIVVDQNAKAPGFAFADLQLHCSVLRPKRILRMIAENVTSGKVGSIANRSFAQANYSTGILAKQLGVPWVDPGVVKGFRNKRKLKEKLAKKGVLVPKAHEWKTELGKTQLLEATQTIIVKPSVGHGKQGISVLSGKRDVQDFLKAHPTDQDQYLVEDYLYGQEITVLAVVKDGESYVYLMTDKIVSQHEPYFVELAHRYPSSASPKALQQIEKVVQKIVSITGMKDGPFVAEFIVYADRPYLVECAPEVGGEYLADYLVPSIFQVNFFQAFLKLMNDGTLGEFRMQFMEPKFSSVIQFIPQRQGIISHLRLPTILDHSDEVFLNKTFKKPGMKTTYKDGNRGRLAVFGLRSPLGEPAWQKAETFVKQADVRYTTV